MSSSTSTPGQPRLTSPSSVVGVGLPNEPVGTIKTGTALDEGGPLDTKHLANIQLDILAGFRYLAEASAPTRKQPASTPLEPALSSSQEHDISTKPKPIPDPAQSQVTLTDDTTSIDIQPPHIANLLKTVSGSPKKAIALPRLPRISRPKPHAFRRFRTRLRSFNNIIYNILVVFWIFFVYIIPGSIFLVVVFLLCVIPSLAILAADGAVALLIGNTILHAAHLAHYTDPASAAAIGATGLVLAVWCVVVVACWLPTDAQAKVPWYIKMPLYTVVMTLSGVIGTSLLHRHHVDIGDIDVLHAARAGALGGAILSPLTAVVGPVIAIAIGILLAPLWVAMAMGFRWAYGRSSETWNGRWHSSSSCYTYGTCGDDPEIDDEIRDLEAMRYGGHYQPTRNMHMDSITVF